eukprot:1703763-Rhodomonas_salina.1
MRSGKRWRYVPRALLRHVRYCLRVGFHGASTDMRCDAPRARASNRLNRQCELGNSEHGSSNGADMAHPTGLTWLIQRG